ncbi:MAG: AAA family ATPase [Blastocatellia bacterium]|nr:AAA family ATPase [Blastocatellia bacterium]
MLIARVELENIKSYESGSFEFGAGVTAISGPNGSGKTTILEAIAWALFDQLPYKKEDFLRRGARKGSVRVTFASALDGRHYTVYRDTASGYHVYDPITKLKLVEQKSQVGSWIKEHLGVEPTTDLKSLFTSTIGVPQGTFTVDFADQPAKRKISFDKVLRVDEYQRSSEELRALVRLIESKEANLREEIARLEGEVAALDGLLGEKSRYETELLRLKRDLAEAERERDRSRHELEGLDALQRSIERMAGESQALVSRIEDIDPRRAVLTEEVQRAREAKVAVESAAAGYESYNDSNTHLSKFEPQVAIRDEISKELSEKEREAFRVEERLRTLREKLKQIEMDRAEMERLSPMVAEQEKLEARRGELQKALGEMSVLRERVESGERDLESLRREYSDLSKQIAEAEALEGEAQRARHLEEERKALELELREMRVALERLAGRRKELTRTRETIARINGETSTLEKEMAAGLAAEQIAATLPQLEIENETAMSEVADLKARIAREEQVLSQVKDGLCPLLSQRCLNMKEGEGLDQYFKAQLGNEQERLALAESNRKMIQRKLADARKALKASSAVSAQCVQLARYKEDLEIKRKEAAQLEREIESTKVDDEQLRLQTDRLGRIEHDLREAQAARSKYESLKVLRKNLERLKSEGTEKRNAQEELKNRLESMSTLSDDLTEVEKRLIELDDPRGRVRTFKASLEKREEIEKSLNELEKRERELSAATQALSGRLEKYAELDQEIARARERRAASEKDYRVYIENQPVAAMLESRETELNTVEKQLEEDREELERLEKVLRDARSDYDEEKHAEVKKRLEELRNLTASLGAESQSARVRVEELNAEIEKLMIARDRMTELAGNMEHSKQLLSLSEFIRELLKKAGPFITEAHLQSISIEANQLYRDITGNPMVSLRWDMGYEVVQEEEGHERPFASLSGGEQMAAALSVRLALLKELSDMRLAFFDEPTTNMDEERRRNLAQQIGRIKDFDQLFVISHDDAFEGFTDRVVSVRGSSDGA